MFCPSCGKELDANNICVNPACPSNSEITSDFEKKISTNNNQNAGYGQNPNYNQNSNYGQNPGYNQNPNYGQNPGYNQNSNYNQNPGYNQGNSYTDQNGISPNEMIDFLGFKNTGYYMDKWSIYQVNPSFTSFNWPALLFPELWFCYRKMYGYAAIIFASSILGSFIPFLSLGVRIWSAISANKVYIKHAVEKIQITKTFYRNDPSALSEKLRSNGGTNWVSVIIALLAIVIVSILVLLSFTRFSYIFRSIFRYI